VKLLLDTQLLLWAAGQPERLPLGARRMLEDARNQLIFSTASIWEIAIKSGLGRSDFRADARLLRWGLLHNGYDELAIAGEHVVAIADLPPIHKDPFDRLLVAQSAVEGILLVTTDPTVAQYPGPVRKVGVLYRAAFMTCSCRPSPAENKSFAHTRVTPASFAHVFLATPAGRKWR
jgi:PIN domain nuclease of toxin-antitoxin system